MFRSIFEEDPFFRMAGDPFRNMQPMMLMDGTPPRQAHQYTAGGRRHTEPPMALSPFGMFGGMGFGGMFSDMRSMMQNMESNMSMLQSSQGGAPGSFYQSSFTSVSYGNSSGQPQVYQSSSSTKTGPNGVKETQKSERNSATGLHKMAIGHHIGERSHVIEKSRNTQTGDKEESQEFINLEEDEAEEFNQEFQERIRSAPNHRHHHRGIAHYSERHMPYRSARHTPAAIEYHQQHTDSSQSLRRERHAHRQY